MHDQCVRKYQIVYQQIEIDTRQTRGRRVTRRTQPTSQNKLVVPTFYGKKSSGSSVKCRAAHAHMTKKTPA